VNVWTMYNRQFRLAVRFGDAQLPPVYTRARSASEVRRRADVTDVTRTTEGGSQL
jgi:hypothetical protein